MDRTLVVRAQAGDREAYEVLAASSVDRLYATAVRIVRDADRADDATQQALVAMWRDLRSLRDPDRFDAWTYRLVVRACLTDLRRTRRVRVTSLPADDRSPASGDATADVQLRDQLDRALATLSADHRAVIVLHHYAGLSLGEIAEILGVPYGTVGSRLHHATRALRGAIEAADRTPSLGGQPA